MNRGFSLSCSTSFLKLEIRTSTISSVTKVNVKLRVTSLVVLLFVLLASAVVVGQGTQSDAAALIAEERTEERQEK